MGRHKSTSLHIYVRFHKAIDEALVKYAHSRGMAKASAAAWLLTYTVAYTRELRRELQIETPVTPEDFHFDGSEDAYFLERGRSSEGRRIGAAMIVTLDEAIERDLQIYAMQLGMTPNQFRTAVLATYLEGRRKN